jgi:hypothetical protein
MIWAPVRGPGSCHHETESPGSCPRFVSPRNGSKAPVPVTTKRKAPAPVTTKRKAPAPVTTKLKGMLKNNVKNFCLFHQGSLYSQTISKYPSFNKAKITCLTNFYKKRMFNSMY